VVALAALLAGELGASVAGADTHGRPGEPSPPADAPLVVILSGGNLDPAVLVRLVATGT
jgi:hypothetical protein